MSQSTATGVSFSLGGGETIIVAMAMRDAIDLLQKYYTRGEFMELHDIRQPSRPFYVNPRQVKILQELDTTGKSPVLT